MSSHKRIGIDIDGVLANFTDAFSDLIVQVSGRDLFPPRPFDPPCWHYPQHYGYTHAELAAVWQEIEKSPEFWQWLPIVHGALTPYQHLMALALDGRHDVYFLSSRRGATAKRQTEHWMHRYWNGLERPTPTHRYWNDLERPTPAHRYWNGLERPTPTILITDNKPYAAIALNLDVVIDDYHVNTRGLALSVPACQTYLLNRSYNAGQFAGIDVVRVDTLEEMFQREGL